MFLLTHQIVVPNILSDEIDRPFTQIPLEHGFVWHLCPLILSAEQIWVLVSPTFGYIVWIEGEMDGAGVEQAVIEAIQCNEPPDREEDCISVNLDPKAMSWRISNEVPVHVATQLKRLQKVLRSCRDLCDADEAVMDLNEQPLKVGNDWIKPREAMQGLMEELADQFAYYVETAPFWKQIWHGLRGRQPWLEG